jgi:Flp pilus assembly protein TadG
MMRSHSKSSALRAYLHHECGAAAAEFAIWLLVLAPTLVNVVDLALYAYDKTQVANAAQSAAQAAYSAYAKCTGTAASCASLGTAVTNAISNSSFLGPKITTATASSTEQYYCADVTTGLLTANGTSSSVCSSGATAGWYYPLKVTYTFTPPFAGLSVINLLNSSTTQCTTTTNTTCKLSQEAWIRLK